MSVLRAAHLRDPLANLSPDVFRWLLALAILATALLLVWNKYRLNDYGFQTSDSVLYSNSLYNTGLDGRFMYNAKNTIGRSITSLVQDHFQPTTVLLKPLFDLFGGHKFLLFFQGIAPAFGALFVWLTARRVGLSDRDAFVATAIYFFNPDFLKSVIDGTYGFHQGSQYILYLPAMVCCAISGRLVLAFLLALLVMGVKENGALYVLGFSCGAFVIRNRFVSRKTAAIGIALALTWLAVMVVFEPTDGKHRHIAVMAFSEGRWLAALQHIHDSWYSLAANGWVALFSPAAIAGALPDAALYLVNGRRASGWYGMPLFTAVGIAIVFGIHVVRHRFHHLRTFQAVVTWLLLIQAVAMMVAGPLEANRNAAKNIRKLGYYTPRSSYLAARDAVGNKECGVSVDLHLLARFYDYPELLMELTPELAKHVVVINDEAKSQLTKYVRAHPDDFVKVYDDDFVIVFKHVANDCDWRINRDRQ